MGFWEAWNAGGASQSDLNKAFANGRQTGHNDMAKWCNNLQDLVLSEASAAVGERVILDLTLEELRKLDPLHWLLVKENRSRIAGKIDDEALKFADKGIAVPNGVVYFKLSNGFLEKRDARDGDVVGVVRKLGANASAMTMGEVGFTNDGLPENL